MGMKYASGRLYFLYPLLFDMVKQQLWDRWVALLVFHGTPVASGEGKYD